MRARAAASRRVRLMRAVHAAARVLGLDDETRHAVQQRVTGKASLRDMNNAEVSALLEHLNRQQGRKRRYPRAPRGDLRLIHAMWGELGRRGVHPLTIFSPTRPMRLPMPPSTAIPP